MASHTPSEPEANSHDATDGLPADGVQSCHWQHHVVAAHSGQPNAMEPTSPAFDVQHDVPPGAHARMGPASFEMLLQCCCR